MIYIVGSLKNIEAIQALARALRHMTDEVIEDGWTSHGDMPDVRYYEYSKARGFSYSQALAHDVARSVFSVDKTFIDKARCVIMLQPCGPSAALELGYAAGLGKTTAIIKSGDYTKIDIMESFATFVANSVEEFLQEAPSRVLLGGV